MEPPFLVRLNRFVQPERSALLQSSRNIVALSLFLGLSLWVVDALLDYLFFYDDGFWDLLLFKVPSHEIYMRLLILACFLGFGLLAGRMVERLHRAQKEAAAHREWLGTTLQSIGDAVIATDDQGQITLMNPTAARLTGWGEDEARGRPLSQVFVIINEHTRRETPDPARRALEAGVVVGLANHTVLVRRDGAEVPIEDSAAPIKDMQGKVTGVVLVFRDVSQRRRRDQERARLEAQLRQSQKLEAMGTLAGGIAHDFNNILGVIMGYSEMALRDLRQGECQEEDLEKILAASQRAKKLVRQILAYSRRSEADLRPLKVNQVVNEAAALLERTLPKMVSIHLELEPEAWSISGDAIQVEQILMNLAANARDAMPRGGRLRIATANLYLDPGSSEGLAEVSPGNYVMLEVSDTGQGMDEATLARAFDPFFTTKEVDQGTGLGLSTVYGIVKNHGGYIVCDSRPNQGTKFRLYFPARDGSPPPAGHASQEQLPRGSERILLVDDEAALRELGRRVLEAAGYRVATAANGEEALARHQELAGEVALVVLDVNMPGMGGQQCLGALRERSPEIKVVIASGYTADNALKQIGQMGVQGFVAKPFLRSELLKTVRQALDGN